VVEVLRGAYTLAMFDAFVTATKQACPCPDKLKSFQIMVNEYVKTKMPGYEPENR
jgi:hypothetical protein